MNSSRVLRHVALFLALGSFPWTFSGCRHGPPKNTTPISETQAPVAKRTPRPDANPREKEFQAQIDLMQEQIKALAARTEALAQFHGLRMPPKWVEKLQAARADASRPAERMRYLEAAKALLARRLESLRSELKVYEEFQASDPTIPRP